MIDTTQLTRQLNTLATRIETFDTSTAQHLHTLSSAITDENTPEIGTWADADIYRVIAPDAIMARFAAQQEQEPREAWYNVWLTPARSVFVLLPVIFVCFSLAQALQTYTSFVHAHPQSTAQSFLYLWQQGFDGQLPGWLSLGGVAALSAVLLSISLAVTLLQRWLAVRQKQEQRQQQAHREQEACQLHSDLAQLLAQLTLYLAQQRSHASSADNLALVARRIDTMSRHMEEKLESVVATFDTMTQNITRHFDDMTTHVTTKFDGTTQNIAERFDGMAQDLTQHYDSTVKDMSSKYEGMSQQTMNRFSMLTDRMLEQLISGDTYLKQLSSASHGIVQTAAQLQTSASLLKETNGELTLNLRNLVGPVVDLAQQQESLIHFTTQALGTLQKAASTLENVGRQQERWGTDLRNVLDSLDLAVEHSTEVALKIGDFTEHQKDLLTRLHQLDSTSTESGL